MILRIALVDDQEMYRLGFRMLLETQEEVEVVGEADDGRSALDLLARVKADVVLMDVRMPGMNGIEATRRIVESGTDGPKVIVLTTFDLDEYAFGSLRSGASAFLLKSTQPEGLVDAVRIVYSGTAVVDPRLTRQLIDHYLQRIDEPATGKREQALAVLTSRERDVFDAIARGLTNSEISSGLHLAPSTVKSYINTIFAKLGVRDRVHAVLLAHDLEHGPLP